MYIDKIKFNRDYRTFTSGDLLDIEPLTLLVGDQGCGKSSLLELLGQFDPDLGIIKIRMINPEKSVDTFFFDTENMNPRTRDPNLYTTPSGKDIGIGYSGAILSKFSSHGECLREFTISPIKKSKNCIIFIDEPEAGLSLKNQYILISEIKKAVKERNCQIILSTHSLVLINSVKKVLNIKTRKWTSSEKFIKTQQI